MTKNFPAAFINAIADEGDLTEAIEWLQKTWNELMTLEMVLIREHGYTPTQIEKMINGEVVH